MASPVLHIKDSFYFDVPKGLYPVHLTSKQQYTGTYETWLRLDPQFQEWEADRFYGEYAHLRSNPAPKEELIEKYSHWKHEDHANAGKPFWRFIQESADSDWFQQRSESANFATSGEMRLKRLRGPSALTAFRSDASPKWAWSPEKLESYSHHLSGKILIPQPFARLRNLYEREWGIGISRFMIIEVGVALVLWLLFSWLARRVNTEVRPRGALWNLLEIFVVFVRDEIVRPVIGHEPHAAHASAPAHNAEHGGSGKHVGPHVAEDPAAKDETLEGGHEPAHHHDPRYDADRFVPLLLTIFFFVLGCNLAGLLPWVGAPTGEWGTTSAIALVTLATGLLFGMRRFGFVGYFLNQIPGMELPLVMAVVLKPMIFAIEMLGLCIKHAILSVRLLANMVAGHIVLLSIVGMAFSLEGAASHFWPMTSVIAVLGSTLLCCLELFVAFLQAYVFTFLSAMFIGAAIHSH